jgi:hypothetical protein
MSAIIRYINDFSEIVYSGVLCFGFCVPADPWKRLFQCVR